MISDKLNDSLRNVDFSLYTRRIALKKDYRKKNSHACKYVRRVHIFEDSSRNFNFRLQTKPIHSKKKTNFYKAPATRTAIARIATLHSLDCPLKVQSGIKKLIEGK